jgi:ADP-dependent phosphofructokinase/glucokinase
VTPWRQRYAEAAKELPALAARAGTTLAGFAACVDVVIRLDGPALAKLADDAKSRDPQVRDLATRLLARMRAGRGGELAVEWDGGPAWVEGAFAGNRTVGGTSAQAAHVLALLGAPVVLALQDRSRAQTEVLHPSVQVAQPDGQRTRVADLVPQGRGKLPHYIFEFVAGTELPDNTVLPRSSRVIVRFADDGMERDDNFAAAAHATRASVALLSGFNGLSAPDWPTARDWTLRLCTVWTAAGVRHRHFELAEYPSVAFMREVLDALGGAITSLGMSLSELGMLTGDPAQPVAAALALAETHQLRRVCVHADDYAFSLTRDDPPVEEQALLAGCLLAVCRAEAGRPTLPSGPPRQARLGSLPLPDLAPTDNGYRLVAVPSLYLSRPAATVGLGDTFLAGTLLVHAVNQAAAPVSTSR